MAGRTTTLAGIAEEVPGVVSVDDAEITVWDVTHDSRNAGPGTIFVAIDGMTRDGHDFVNAAIEAGSPAVVVERQGFPGVPACRVTDSRRAMAYIAAAVHGNPARSMTMVGVTGTNGKTTVGAMCESALRADERSAGVIGTLGARIDGEPIPLSRTTPESSDLQRLLASMRDRTVDTVVMEVSSHALELHRADAIIFDVAAFTNLSQDHLDFHGDMASYFAAKSKLFESGRARHGVINVADPAGRELANTCDIPLTTVGFDSDADIRGTILAQSATGTTFLVTAGDEATEISMPLAGAFNVANALVAYAVCSHIGVSTRAIAEGLESLAPIAGRMENVEGDADITVIVDYAHTPAAVSTVVEAASAAARGALITVVGAGGDRDQNKRPLMGAAAARHSDITVITTDNPRSEDPVVIIDAVAAGAEAQGRGTVIRIVDRAAAIAQAVEMADPGDTVLILGRGHESHQEVMGEFIPFRDVDVARTALDTRRDSARG